VGRPYRLRQIAATTAENVEIADVRIAFQLLLNLKRQPLHAASHVCVARRDPHPNAARNRDHGRSAFKVAAINAEGAPAPIRTRALFTSTTMTSDAPAKGGETNDADDVSMTTGANPGALAHADFRASRRHL
jgi:hypothetical protein